MWQTIRSTLATALCEAFEAAHPGCRAHVLVQVPTDLYEPLRRGDVDVLLMRLPAAPDALPAEPGIVFGPVLGVDDRAVLVVKEHPLAGRSEVTLDDVAEYEVALITDWPQAFGDLWIPPTAPNGRPIRRFAVSSFKYLDEILDMVSRSHLVHVTITGLLEMIPRPD